MSEIDPENTENGGGASGTSVVARGTIEASRRALDRVRAEFPEDELVLQRTPDPPPFSVFSGSISLIGPSPCPR